MAHTTNPSFNGFHSPISGKSSMSLLVSRVIRAMKLKMEVFDEVEGDTRATGQSLIIITLSSIAAGIGSYDVNSAAEVVINSAAALAGWFVWAFLTLFIGTRLMPEPQTQADYGQMIRTIGFASSPGLLRIFGFIPYLGPALFILAQIWMLLAMIVAIKQALDYTSRIRAVLVSVFGWILQIAIISIILFLTQPQ